MQETASKPFTTKNMAIAALVAALLCVVGYSGCQGCNAPAQPVEEPKVQPCRCKPIQKFTPMRPAKPPVTKPAPTPKVDDGDELDLEPHGKKA